MKIIQKRKEKVLSFFDINNEFFIDRYYNYNKFNRKG